MFDFFKKAYIRTGEYFGILPLKGKASSGGDSAPDGRTQDLVASPDFKKENIGKGIGNSRTSEGVPKYDLARAEKIFSNGSNASLVVGKDRPASKLSGYGGRGDMGAGTIDIVAGRMSHNPKSVDNDGNLVFADPNFKVDASRIYISQKTDVDANFDLIKGKVGNSKARAAIAIKSDGVRIVGREGVKIVTGTDVKNSQGKNIYSVSGIDLIAGNDDSKLQPLVLGENANESLEKLTNYVDQLAGIVSSAITYQMKYNAQIMAHSHITAFFGTPTTPAPNLISSGIQVMVDHGGSTLTSLIKFRTNLKFHKQTYYVVSGAKYINSSFNNTN
jgi:hypothetical protein